MKRQDMSLTIALCAAIGAYSILVRLAADGYTREVGAQLTSPAAPANAIDLLVDRDRLHIGQTTGTGDAIMAAPGELPQLALKANQNQPFLSRDPVGFGMVGNEPTDSIFLQRPGVVSPYMPEAPAAPFGVATGDLPSPVIKRPGEEAAQDNPPKDTPPPQFARANPAPSADPAPMSDSEIDAFSKTNSVEFRMGKTDVQFGRKVKITRPKITISGQFDVLSLGSARVVLMIRTDSAGDVYDVRIVRSSGSTDIDLACQRAAYTWWFEPPKDPLGKARADAFPFTIGFQ